MVTWLRLLPSSGKQKLATFYTSHSQQVIGILHVRTQGCIQVLDHPEKTDLELFLASLILQIVLIYRIRRNNRPCSYAYTWHTSPLFGSFENVTSAAAMPSLSLKKYLRPVIRRHNFSISQLDCI